MVFKNISGQSYQFYPGSLTTPNQPGSTIEVLKQISGNKIMFFAGAIPTLLETINLTKTNLEAYTKLCETPEFGITYTYDKVKKKRYVRKIQIDALDMEYLADGTIGWAAIILENPESATEHIIATDSIGQWGENTMPIILDNKNGTTGSRNTFKNISIELTDNHNNL